MEVIAEEKNLNRKLPDERGHFGIYGGKYVPEILIPVLDELEDAYKQACKDISFQSELSFCLKNYSGRPTPLYFAERLTQKLGGAKIYLKREDLNHTGAHKINNALGQILLSKQMGKSRIIAETGAGQHGVATATVAARFGLQCVVYMGEEDIRRQRLNVFRMRLLGTEVRPVSSGSQTLKDAINEAIRDWVTNVENTFYLIGSVVGPHPYPMMVRDFQSVIGHETQQQIFAEEKKSPACLVACVGGGSNAMGLFYPFLSNPEVKMIGVEAAGLGLNSGRHSAPLCCGCPGVLHGAMSYLLQDGDGQIQMTHSVSAGLDYPGVGPEHSYLKDSGRVEYLAVTDEEALDAFELLAETEGIIPALESAHAIAALPELVHQFNADDSIVVCLSGRGDKDVEIVAKQMGFSV